MGKANVAAEMRAKIAATQRRDPPPEVDELARRWIDGESLQVLAKECGVEAASTIHRRIKRWILAGHGDKAYADLVTEALVNKIADADLRMEEASDPVEITKWREVGRFARMDFERRRPALYGSKPVNLNVVNLVPDAGLIGRASELLQLVAPAREEKLVPAVPEDVQ